MDPIIADIIVNASAIGIDVPSSNIDIASYKAYITEFGLSFRQIACGISPANC